MAIRDLDGVGDEGQFDDCWDVLIREHARYERLTRAMCRGHLDLQDELLSEVYIRAPQVAETWDPSIGTLAAHLHSSITWYLWKLMNKLERDVARSGGELGADSLMMSEADSCPSRRREDQAIRSLDISEASDLVVFLREHLSLAEWWLIEARHIKGYTFEVIADLLPVELGGPLSNVAARKAYQRALDKAREILRDDE